MQKWADGGERGAGGALIFVTLLFFLHFQNDNCLPHNGMKVSLLIKSEEEGELRVCQSNTHLMVSNSV